MRKQRKFFINSVFHSFLLELSLLQETRSEYWYHLYDNQEAAPCAQLFFDLEKSDNKPENGLDEFAARRLYVLTPDDVLELTPSEVDLVWQHRETLCGSIEAAAEVFAFKRFHDGTDQHYAGFQRYLNDPEIIKLAPSKTDTKIQSTIESEHKENYEIGSEHTDTPSDQEHPKETTLSLSYEDVVALDIENLSEAWAARRQLFKDLRSAAEALARLRYENKTDQKKKAWTDYLNHPLIVELKEYLPDDEASTALAQIQPQAKIEEDQRERRPTISTLRDGQSEFRAAILRAFNYRCCITQVAQPEILQAAHISPYRGAHTNSIDNGLLLRVDLHTLFDRHLLSINPSNLRVEINKNLVRDKYYLAIDGTQVDFSMAQPNLLHLRKHYQRFLTKKTFSSKQHNNSSPAEGLS